MTTTGMVVFNTELMLDDVMLKLFLTKEQLYVGQSRETYM